MRQVIHTPEFEAECFLIEPCVATFDDFMDGVIWVLSHDPTQGTHIEPPNGHVWKVDMAPPPHDYRSVTIYYTFNDETVVLLGVRARTPID